MTDLRSVPAIPRPDMFIGQDGITPPGYSYLNELSTVLGEVRSLLSTVEGTVETNSSNIADILGNTTPATNIGFADAQQGIGVVATDSSYFEFLTFNEFTPASDGSRIVFDCRVKLQHYRSDNGSNTGYSLWVCRDAIPIAEMSTDTIDVGATIGTGDTAEIGGAAIITGQTGEHRYSLHLKRGGSDVEPEIFSTPLPFGTMIELLV